MNTSALELVAQHPGVDVGSRIREGHLYHAEVRGDPSEQNFLHSHVKLPSHDILSRFKQNIGRYSHLSFLANKNLSKEHLHDALDSIGHSHQGYLLHVANFAVKNPNHDSSHLKKLISIGSESGEIMRSLKWKPEELHSMATSGELHDFRTHEMVFNRNMPKETLQHLSNHNNKDIAKSAEFMLNQRFGE